MSQIFANPVKRSTAVFTTDPMRSKPKPVNIPVEETDSTEEWAPYGEMDNFPNLLVDKLKMLSIGRSALGNNADAHYGAGIQWIIPGVNEKGKLTRTPVMLPEWTAFAENTNYNLVHGEFVSMMEVYYWCPVRFLTNIAGDKILELEALDPMFCRISERKKQTRSTHLYFSYLHGNSGLSEKDWVKYPIYDPTEPYKHKEFIYLFFYRTLGMKYYPEPDYYSVFRNKWVDVAISVPELINAIYSNASSIKYHVHIPMMYFKTKYKDWDDKSEEEQIKLYGYETDSMNQFLTGSENAHKTFMSVFGTDEYNKEIPGWKIEPIKNYLDSTAELPNNAAANSEILFAMGNDPALVGHGIPGGKNLSGSGSDKREAMKNKQANLHMERTVTLQLPRFIAKFNQMNTQGAEPRYLDVDTSSTLDENPTGKETVING